MFVPGVCCGIRTRHRMHKKGNELEEERIPEAVFNYCLGAEGDRTVSVLLIGRRAQMLFAEVAPRKRSVTRGRREGARRIH